MNQKNNWLCSATVITLTMGLVTSCLAPMSMGSNNGPPASRGFREFYVRPGVTQYFLLPQRLMAAAGHYAEMDLVVRDSAAVPYYALLHVSVVENMTASSRAAFELADTLLLSISGPALPVAGVKILFSENKGNTRLTRLEAALSPAQVVAYLHGSAHILLVSRSGTGRTLYQPGKKETGYLRAFAATVAPPLATK